MRRGSIRVRVSRRRHRVWRVYLFHYENTFPSPARTHRHTQETEVHFSRSGDQRRRSDEAVLQPATATGWTKSLAQSRGAMENAAARKSSSPQEALTIAASLCEARPWMLRARFARLTDTRLQAGLYNWIA